MSQCIKSPVSGDESPGQSRLPGLSRHSWPSFAGVCPLIFTVASPTSYDSLYFASIPSSLAPSHRAASFQQRASARCRCAGRSWQAACRAVFCRWPWTRRTLPRRIADGPYEGRFPARWPRRGQGLRPAPETRCLTGSTYCAVMPPGSVLMRALELATTNVSQCSWLTPPTLSRGTARSNSILSSSESRL